MRHLVAILIIILLASVAVGIWAWFNGIPLIDEYVVNFNSNHIDDEVLQMDDDETKQVPAMLLVWFSTASILTFTYFFWNQKRND